MKKLFVLCAAAIFVVAFTAPAFAAEWSFYGSARMAMFWTNQDMQDSVTPAGEDDKNTMNHSLQGNSRIGANVKAGDNLTGKFEYGVTGQTTGTHEAARVRQLYGEYDFGGFSLLVGKGYTPMFYLISNQVYAGDNDLIGYGAIFTGRTGMVQAQIGGFKFALVQPVSSTTLVDPATGISYGGLDTEISWPKLEASYLLNAGGFSAKFMGGYNQYKVLGADKSETLSSYVGAIGAKFNAGPFVVGADVYYGVNAGNYGFYTGGNGFAGYDTAKEDILDNTAFGWMFFASFTMSDMLTFEGGLGATSNDMDNTSEDDDGAAWYVNATINLAKGVFIVPEIGQLNNGKDFDGKSQPKTTYYGLKWQINF
jgi:hypothetical protein